MKRSTLIDVGLILVLFVGVVHGIEKKFDFVVSTMPWHSEQWGDIDLKGTLTLHGGEWKKGNQCMDMQGNGFYYINYSTDSHSQLSAISKICWEGHLK